MHNCKLKIIMLISGKNKTNKFKIMLHKKYVAQSKKIGSTFKLYVRKYAPVSSAFDETYLTRLQFLACRLRKNVSLACKLYLVSNTEGRFVECLCKLILCSSQPVIMTMFVITHHNNLRFF